MGSEAEIRRGRVRRLMEQVIFPATQPLSAPLSLSIARLAGEPIPPAQCASLEFEPFEIGETWGGAWATAWFKAEGSIPEAFDGQHVVARIDLGYRAQPGFGGEAILFDGSRPVQGINPKHNTVELSPGATAGDPVHLLVEAAANPATAEGPLEWPLLMPDYDGRPLYRLRQFDLAVVDDEMTEVLFDWTVLTELADCLGPSDRRSAEILDVLDRVARTIDLHDLRTSLVARRAEWEPLLASTGAARRHRVTAVGHAHIDSAWLWPIRETKRKCARTFSSAIRLMESSPEFVFVCSQAQQHAWMEEEYPELFAEMQDRVAAGQLEPVGSMWVEPDTNVPSGESLVRQLVAGKRFFLDRYGVETVDCWLPDAFGYSGNLPQILRSAGVRRFLTQKLSWNEIDRFPHHTFWWEGIDGTRVLAHCPPTDTYNGEFTVGQLLLGERQYAQHGLSERSLYLYGYGDGGGGPTAEMLERARRVADLDPLPTVSLDSARSFFDAVEQEAIERDELVEAADPATTLTAHAQGPGGLPVWVGELYLERHRAVQTTQARSKLGNRRSERLLREAELWCAASLTGDDATEAAGEIAEVWRTVLLHQFHDILPGSSIHWVHADSRAAYAAIERRLGHLIDRATSRLAAEVTPGEGSGTGRPLVVLNGASTRRESLVELEGAVAGSATAARSPAGALLPLQRLADGRVALRAEVDGSGWARYELVEEEPPALDDPVVVTGDRSLSNGLVSVELDELGFVRSIRDLATGRETIAPGERANLFQLHHDLPTHFDAWDVDQGAFERALEPTGAESVEIVEHGPLRAAIEVRWRIGERSTVVQQIRVEAGSRQVEFATEVDWAERHRFLKVAFPVDVRAAHATYEIQFGHLPRATHANTSWDAARFEVPAQRFADLSDGAFGVALINDCKYGYDIRGNVMRLSLLRGPGWPDPVADEGSHRFSYAIRPHAGIGTIEEVVDAAEQFNLPLRAVTGSGSGGSRPDTGHLVAIDGARLSALKPADDASGDLVVRCYEHRGTRSLVRIHAPGMTAATRVDALERPLGALGVSDGAVSLELRPFELVTVQLRR